MGIMEYAELSRRQLEEDKVDLRRFEGYLYSEKLDGWHVIWDGKGKLYTKSGKIVLPAPDAFLAMLPQGTAISAELVLRRQQATAVAALRNRKNAHLWAEARLYAFDLPAERDKPFKERTALLKRVVAEQCKRHHAAAGKCPLRYVVQKTIGRGATGVAAFLRDYEHIVACTGTYKRTGECFGEGVVVTNPESLYTTDKRATRATRFKLKRRADAEATVIGHNGTKSLLVSYNSVEFHLGVGLTKEQKLALPTHFPRGSKVKFSFRALGENGKPKEARILGRRYAADTKAARKPSVPRRRQAAGG